MIKPVTRIAAPCCFSQVTPPDNLPWLDRGGAALGMRGAVGCKFRALRVLGVLASLALTCPASAEKRVALVIGNSGYQNVTRLDNPRSDAVLMAETLGGLGFTLIGGRAQLDLDKSAMDTAVRNFGRQVQGADVARDSSDGHNPYTRALASTIKQQGLDIFQTFNQVGLAVKRETGGRNYNGIAVISSGHVSGRSGSGTSAGRTAAAEPGRRRNSETIALFSWLFCASQASMRALIKPYRLRNWGSLRPKFSPRFPA